MRPPVKWHGGKYYLAKRIVELMPTHRIYVEPFGGAASVLLNKPPSEVEVYNDLDERITRLFRVLRDRSEEFLQLLRLTPYSEREWQRAAEPAQDELEQARRDFVRWRMSLGGRGEGFSYSVRRSRRGMADVVSGYLSAIDEELPKIVQRLRTVQILCRDAFEVIAKWDSPETLFYCDPPYPSSVVVRDDIYGYTLSDDQHAKLLGVLRCCTGKVILSGYANPLYDKRLSDWRRIEVDLPNNAAGGKKKRRCTEVLWLNF